MSEYDNFAETYQHWIVTDNPYRAVELYSFFSVLGPVRGLEILDLAAGEGRTARMLMEAGAASVMGTDVSAEMVRRASERNAVPGAGHENTRARTWPNLSFSVLDAADDDFQLTTPVDLVTAMYLFHYAPTKRDLDRMAKLIARNLRPGGRFVTYTLSPDYDFHRAEPLLQERCGFDYSAVSGNHCTLNIGADRVNIWQWDRQAHETSLSRAGFTEIQWHALQSPPDAPKVAAAMDFYLSNPSCIVLSATKDRRLES